MVAWSGLADPRIPARVQPAVRAGLGTVLVAVTRAPLGLRPPQLWTGLRLGCAMAVPIIVGVAASTAVAPVRSAMADRDLPAQGWLAVRIPIGTVWPEEAMFRAALGTAAAEAFGPTRGRLLQAAAFGLSHIADARGTGEPLAATVAATGFAGWWFALLYERSASLAAPMLAHLAINEAGALAAVGVQRRRA
ncbi:abortive phage infection protein [Mycobacterium sp. 1274761.0]|nr:abortive phage infection protein [Mycobacterium sp. 1274761.0]